MNNLTLEKTVTQIFTQQSKNSYQDDPQMNPEEEQNKQSQENLLKNLEKHRTNQEEIQETIDIPKSYPTKFKKYLNKIAIFTILPIFAYIFLIQNQNQYFIKRGATWMLLVLIIFYSLEVLFSKFYNKIYIKKLKESSIQLPTINIQIIGKNIDFNNFQDFLQKVSFQTYKDNLIGRVVFCIDGTQQENRYMRQVFQQIFPFVRVLNLQQKFLNIPLQQQEQILANSAQYRYLIITQPHGTEKQLKFTADKFSSINSEYVFNCKPCNFIQLDFLENLATTVSGYNTVNNHLKRCGIVFGDAQNHNLFKKIVFFHNSKGANSYFNSEIQIYESSYLIATQIIQNFLQEDHANQLSNQQFPLRVIEDQYAVLYDSQAKSQIFQSYTVSNYIAQTLKQWKKIFLMLPKIFSYHFWIVLSS